MITLGIIPARYKSSRFPGKPLVPILGKPMIIHVLERTAIALGHDATYAATDDERIAEVVVAAGYQVVMTTEKALTGTDRLWQAAQQLSGDIYVNVQGDEPLVNPDDIRRIAFQKINQPNFVINGMCAITDMEDPHSVNIPKVVTNESKHLVYMSRSALPGYKTPENKPSQYWKQVCIYAFSYSELRLYGEFGRKSQLEQHEDIEILRFFDLNIPVQMVETVGASLAVDIPDDVARVEAAMRSQQT